MSKRKFSGNISGKGYYIALFLCAVAIGISGYLYYRNANNTDPQLQDPPDAIGNIDPSNDPNVDVVATDPDNTNATKPTDNTNPPKTGRTFKTAGPVGGETVAEYAMDCLSYNQTTRDWRTHNGIDIAAEAGTVVCASADGTVYTVYEDDAMGMTVVIRHDDGYVTRYSSLAQEVSVQPGDSVALGQAIGSVGNTALLESAIGDHLHFSVTCQDQPVNPADFLKQE